MSPAQKLRQMGFNASLKTRGVSLAIQPGEVAAVGLVEPVDEHSRRRLQIADERVTHIVHIGRDALGGVNLAVLSVIQRADTDATYRVEYYQDDAQRPAILFHCVLG